MIGSGTPSSQSNMPRPIIISSLSPVLSCRSPAPADVAIQNSVAHQRASSTSRMMMGIGIPRSHNKIGMT